VTEKRFYVYVIRDPRPGKRKAPIYVGKGHGRRAWFHFSPKGIRLNANRLLANTLAKILSAGLEPIVEIVARFKYEKTAYAREQKLVGRYGRIDLGTGILCNLTNGGEGGNGSQSSAFKRLNHDPKFQKRRRAAFDLIWSNEDSRARAIAHRRNNMRKRLANPKTRREHQELGRANMIRLNRNPNHRAKCVAGLRQRIATDPEFREQKSKQGRESMRNLWADDGFRQRHSAVSSANMSRNHADPKFQKKHAARMQAQNVDPDFQERRVGGLRKTMATAAYQRKHKAALRKLNTDPAFQKRRIAAIRRYWKARRAKGTGR
jgi:hypothetical protein